MPEHEKINYVELPASDMDAVQGFFAAAFGWTFTDYGGNYIAFSGQGLDGGFYKSPLHSSAADGAALIVFYSNDLEATEEKIIAAGGKVVKPVFSFPGGRRFHFSDPCGNEYAVWSDRGL